MISPAEALAVAKLRREALIVGFKAALEAVIDRELGQQGDQDEITVTFSQMAGLWEIPDEAREEAIDSLLGAYRLAGWEAHRDPTDDIVTFWREEAAEAEEE